MPFIFRLACCGLSLRDDGLEPTAPGRLSGGDTGGDSVAARVFHLLVYIFLVPVAGLVDNVLDLVLLDFVRPVGGVLELLLLGLVLLLLEILFGLNIKTGSFGCA
ncbi:MAG TPA: hypothetical protein VII22_16290 [Streptosporangiaceae bacterium]